MSEHQGQDPQGQTGGEPIGQETNVERLLEEFGSLYQSLSKHQRTMAVMFADLKGSTAIFGERSDIEGILVLQRCESLIRPAVEAHSGTVVKTIGDAVMASFPSSDDAVRAAISVQKALETHNRELAAEDRLFVRIGINTGKGFIKGHDVFGQVVNIAAKVQGASEGGQIIISRTTYESMEKELVQLAVSRGSMEVSGLSHPVGIYQVLWQEERRSVAAEPLRVPLVEEREEEDEGKLLVVDISLEGERLKVCAFERYPGEEKTLKPYEELPYPRDLIEKLRQDLFDVLNQANPRGVLEQPLMEELERLGQLLFESLFPQPVRERLLQSSISDLLLHTDDRLVQIPWELVFDGQEFLSQKFNMGRVVRTRQALSERETRPLHGPLRMLIIANPRGDLEASHLEGAQIRDSLLANGMDVEIEILHSEITMEEAGRGIQDFDILHFAGHARYNIEAPETSSWMFSDGELTSSEISSLADAGPLPSLVFSNACQSGYTEEWKVSEHLGREIYGMANAFLLSGVQHYIGTFWEIPDPTSAQFALAFYKELVKGATIGEALRQARRSIIERFGKEAVVWASYMLYGDPTVSLFQPERRPSLEVVAKPVVEERVEEAIAVEAPPEASSPAEPARRGGGLTYGLAAAAAALVLAVGGYFILSKGSGGPEKAATQPPQASIQTPSKPSAASGPSTQQAGALLTLSQVENILKSSKNFDSKNLSGLNLQGQNFSGASFKGSDLSGADLSGARLWAADLKGANLKNARFKETNLLNADLRGADLSNADLAGANLHGANLDGAIFSGANLEGAKDLWKANNVEKALGIKDE
jgi:class 3 adenylate cyclase/CHAT domain-containing protein